MLPNQYLMLNIVNFLGKNKIKTSCIKKGETIRVHKRDIPLSKEWCNSVYVFSKNSLRFLPAIHNHVFKLLKSYFNMTCVNLDVNIRSRKYKKIRRSQGSKVWVSTPEIKHFSEKLSITIYVYNKLYSMLKKNLTFTNISWKPEILKIKEKNPNLIVIKKYAKINQLTDNCRYLSTTKVSYENFYKKMIKWLKLDKYIHMEQYKLNIIELIKKENKSKLVKGLTLLNFERYNYLINQFKRELIYLKLRQKILFNEFKFNELYLTPVINFLQTIYKKKVELNIVMLKNYYLSSSILSQIIVAKVISKKYRGRASAPLGNSMAGAKIPNLSSKIIVRVEKKWIGIQNVVLDTFIDKQDNLNEFLLTNKKNSDIWSSKHIDKLALKNLENKSIAGIFLNISGRLTKRYKAQRAINHLRYKGTLKNVHSAHKGYCSALSRGYSNINVEKTMIHSKVRIGAFGLTGWVASY